MFQPEPLSAVITAVALILTAVGGFAVRRGASEGKRRDPADEMRKVIESNTKAVNEGNAQFAANNGLFSQVLAQLIAANAHLKEIERDGTDQLQVLRAMRDEELRQGRRDR